MAGAADTIEPSDWPDDSVFTIGHSTLPIEAFIRLLQRYDIACLTDIRTIPKSRHNPQFNGEDLKQSLADAGIGYRALPALGGLRRPRRDSPNTGWRNESFRGYADHMQTSEFQEGLRTLMDMSLGRRVAIMCAEAVPWHCHRSLVADALSVRGIPVVEILSQTSHRLHKLTEFAHVEGDRITYPARQGTLL